MPPYSVEPAAQHSFLSGHLHLCIASMRVPCLLARWCATDPKAAPIKISTKMF
jgi:hypothetical protein